MTIKLNESSGSGSDLKTFSSSEESDSLDSPEGFEKATHSGREFLSGNAIKTKTKRIEEVAYLKLNGGQEALQASSSTKTGKTVPRLGESVEAVTDSSESPKEGSAKESKEIKSPRDAKRMQRRTVEIVSKPTKSSRKSPVRHTIAISPQASSTAALSSHCQLYLRSIHEALAYIPSFGSCRLQWIENFGLAGCFEESIFGQKHSFAFERIVETLNHALSMNIRFFTDRYGTEVSLEELILRLISGAEGLKDVYAKPYLEQLVLLSKTAAHMKEREVDGSEALPLAYPLPLTYNQPHNTEDREKPESICSTLLSRLYSPENTEETRKSGAIHPLTLICTYRRWASTEQLFSEICEALQHPSETMSVMQKLEMLKFLKLWIICGLNFKEKDREEVRHAIREVIIETKGLENKNLRSVAEEIFLILHNPFNESPQIRLGEGSKSFEFLIGNTWGLKPGKLKYSASLKQIRDEVHRCSVHLFLSFEAHELLFGLDKTEAPQKVPNLLNLVSFYNKLTQFVITTILKPANILESVDGISDKVKRRILGNVRERYLFFIDLADALHRIRDFPAAWAVFGAISCPAISRMFLKNTQFNDNSGKLISEEIRIDKKIPKSAMSKLGALGLIYNPEKSFASLRKEYDNGDDLYLPFLALTLSDIVHIEDGNPDRVDRPFPINIEKLNLLAQAILPILQSQRRQYFELHSLGHQSLETDLFSFIQTCQVFGEDYNYQLSRKLR